MTVMTDHSVTDVQKDRMVSIQHAQQQQRLQQLKHVLARA